MSYIYPGADTRHIIEDARNSKNLRYLKSEEDRRELLELQKHYTPEQIERMLARRNATPKEWSRKDDVLTRLGFLVTYKPDSVKGVRKSVTNFDSQWANQKIKQYKLNTTEKELLDGVRSVDGECNLKNTELESLGTVERIGGNLRIYTNSSLKDLSSLKRVDGSVCVYAKNEQEMKDFIEKVKLNNSIVKGKIVFIPTTYL